MKTTNNFTRMLPFYSTGSNQLNRCLKLTIFTLLTLSFNMLNAQWTWTGVDEELSTGSANIYDGNVYIDATGGSTSNGNLTVRHNAQIGADARIHQNLDVDQDANIDGNATFHGQTKMGVPPTYSTDYILRVTEDNGQNDPILLVEHLATGTTTGGGLGRGAWISYFRPGTKYNTGLEVYGGNSTGENIGITAKAYSTASALSALNYGVYAEAGASNAHGTNISLYGRAGYTLSLATNYAVYGHINPSASSTCYAGYFDGDVTVTGTFSNPSDRMFKKDVKPLENAIDILDQLNPKSYYFKNKDFPSINLPEKHQFGLVAQDVEKVLPELVHNNVHVEQKDDEGNIIHDKIKYKSVNYIALVPVLIQGAKEQQQEIEDLRETVELLKNQLSSFNGAEGNILNGTSPDQKEGAKLHQNAPNPFSESTTIKYTLPNNSKEANMLILDMTGKLLQTYALNNSTSLIINGRELDPGMYHYSLVVDGQLIDTKSMILTD